MQPAQREKTSASFLTPDRTDPPTAHGQSARPHSIAVCLGPHAWYGADEVTRLATPVRAGIAPLRHRQAGTAAGLKLPVRVLYMQPDGAPSPSRVERI